MNSLALTASAVMASTAAAASARPRLALIFRMVVAAS
jgi:hypothetical protein